MGVGKDLGVYGNCFYFVLIFPLNIKMVFKKFICIPMYTLIYNRGLAHEMGSITTELTEKKNMEMEQGKQERRGSGSITEGEGIQDTFKLMQKRRVVVRCLWLSSCSSCYHLLFRQSEKLHCDSIPPRSSDFSMDLFNCNHLRPTPES